MDKVGIPRGLFYYYYGDFWKIFFDYLKIPYIISPNTNKKIIDKGIKVSNDEMCYGLKIYLGHVSYLMDKCNYILIPRIDNFKDDNQTCTNFLSAYDIVNNIFDIRILNYNIDLEKGKDLKKGMINIGKELGFKKNELVKAYRYALKKYKKMQEKEINKNKKKLRSRKLKVLLVSHPYIVYDEYIGKDIVKYLEENKITVIFSDKFDKQEIKGLSDNLSKDLYFKYSKDNLSALEYSKDKIDGVIFLSAFPCGPDSLANEMAMRKINKPYISLVVDDNSSFTGFETRLESFIDMLKGDNND